jgi:hypothetical protein
MRRATRSIAFGGHVYRVRVSHRHHVTPEGACAEVLTVFRADRPGRVARVVFLEGDGRGRGYPGIAVSSFLVPRREALRGGASWRPPPATW